MICGSSLPRAHERRPVLTGIGAALNRDRSDAVWVRMEHVQSVATFASSLKEADDTLKARKRTTADEDSAYRVRKDIMRWLGNWDDIRLSGWWQLGHAVDRNVSSTVTPVAGAIVEMGGSYWLSTHGHTCTLDTLQELLDKARTVSGALDREEARENPETMQRRADLQEWLDTWDANDLEHLWNLAHVVNNNRGSMLTPVEDLICQLGLAYRIKDGAGRD